MSQDVLFIAPIYKYYPILLHSLRAQTTKHWQLILLHDGPAPRWLRDNILGCRDGRVVFHETAKRANQFGHNLRALGLETAALLQRYEDCVAIVHTNADNYYVPRTVGTVRRWIINNPSIAAIYFDCLHNYFGYQHLIAEPKYSKVDLGCVVYQYDIALHNGFRYRGREDDWLVFENVIKQYGIDNIRKIPGVFLVHN